MATESFTVELTYFKPSGKYYSEGIYETQKEYMFQIFNEVRLMQKACRLPGLIDGRGFIVLVDSPNHPDAYPGLVIPD